VVISGPFVSLAVFCDEVIRDRQGLTSLARLTELIVILDEGPAELPIKGVIWTHAGEARGVHSLHAVVRDQSGHAISTEFWQRLEFFHEDESVLTVIDFVLRPTDEGLHWLEVSIDRRLTTKAPLVIRWAADSRRAK
jgi:hypothetical protein